MNWFPSASIAILKQRALLLQKIRHFYTSRGYLEVETPLMSQYGISDLYLENIKAYFRNKPYCLQTSPEYHMKRLLAAGSGPIFQISKAFRDDELGRWHNPEFTILEWYQLDVDHFALMDELDELLQAILTCPPLIKKTYQQVFEEICHINPFEAAIAQLQDTLGQYDLTEVLERNEVDKDQYLFLLMSHVIEPALSKSPAPVAVHSFPPSQAALARIKQGVAERFEIYFKGVELVNGFHELTDKALQADRFALDQKLRAAKNLPYPAIDEYFIAALEHGLPPCSGAALGIDRLIALALGLSGLSPVLSFDFSKA